MAGFATLCWVDMECANPSELGEFYRQALGWDITHYPDEAAVITDGGTSIRFGRVDGYQPPSWPDLRAERYHMDLDVDDVAEAVERCLGLGASSLTSSPVMASAGRYCSTRPGTHSAYAVPQRSKRSYRCLPCSTAE